MSILRNFEVGLATTASLQMSLSEDRVQANYKYGNRLRPENGGEEGHTLRKHLRVIRGAPGERTVVENVRRCTKAWDEVTALTHQGQREIVDGELRLIWRSQDISQVL